MDRLGKGGFPCEHSGALVDILPALLSRRERPWAIGPLLGGDSYGVLQSIHLEAGPEVTRFSGL